MEQETKKNHTKIIFIIIAVVVVILAVIMNSNNDEKYLEVAKRTLPQMKTFLLDTVEETVNLKQDILTIMKGYKYSQEVATNELKNQKEYKYFTMKIDEKMSEMYKDLEYLKKHTYSKDRDLSTQIKETVEKFEKSIEEHRELKVDSTYKNDEKDIYEKIQELQNKVNRE